MLEATITDSLGRVLFTAPGASPLDGLVLCYSYAGYFVNSGDAPLQSIEAYMLTGVPAAPLAGLYPVDLEAMERVSIQTSTVDPIHAYLRALPEEPSVYFIRTDGQAWTRVRWDEIAPGRVIELSERKAGSVAFAVPELALQIDPSLLVMQDGQEVMRPRASAVEGRHLDGWAPGQYSAFLTTAFSNLPDRAFTDVVAFEVTAGTSTTVAFQLAAGLDPTQESSGELEGTLRFESWELVEPWHSQIGLILRIERLGERSLVFDGMKGTKRRIPPFRMEEISGIELGDPEWIWRAGDYPAGDYRAWIDPLAWSVDFTVLPNQLNHLDILVPELARAVVTVSGALPGWQQSIDCGLFDRSSHETGKGMLQLRHVALDSQSIQTISRPGTYLFSTVLNGQSYDQEVELTPGWNTVEVVATRQALASIELVTEQGELVPTDRSVWSQVTLRHLETGERAKITPSHVSRNGKSMGYCRAQVQFFRPGEYSVAGLDLQPGSDHVQLAQGVRHSLVVASDE